MSTRNTSQDSVIASCESPKVPELRESPSAPERRSRESRSSEGVPPESPKVSEPLRGESPLEPELCESPKVPEPCAHITKQLCQLHLQNRVFSNMLGSFKNIYENICVLNEERKR